MTQPSFDEYAEALRELQQRHAYLAIELDFGVLIAIIGACQLALRHPDYPRYSHGLLTRWITDVANSLPSEQVRQIILNGFHQEYDQ